MTGVLSDVRLLAARSVRRTFRQPALVVPTIVFPLFLLAVNASGLASATKIPGFPTSSYLDFAITVPFMQGALFASTTAGTEIANDIETGFLNRLQLTPLRGTALLTGQMAGAVLLAFVGALIYLAVGLIAGVSVKTGVLGVVALLAFVVLMILAFGAIGLYLAVRTGSAEQVQGLFALALGLLFLSSMVMPRNLIKADWFKEIATYNPMSYLVEAGRSLLITGWDGKALALGVGISVAAFVVALTVSITSLRGRLLRT